MSYVIYPVNKSVSLCLYVRIFGKLRFTNIRAYHSKAHNFGVHIDISKIKFQREMVEKI